MDKSGNRFAILYLWKTDLGVKRIRAGMKQTLGLDAGSKAQMARCLHHFEQVDFSCKDESKPGRTDSVCGQLSPDSSRSFLAQARELLQPTSEVLEIP
jgi:hypothetical protein